MIDFIYQHPDYLFFLFLCLFFLYKVVLSINNNNQDEDDSDDDGGSGELPEDPILDLPPGVSMPVDKELQTV